jgi:VCBS repeat-containing protein
MGKRKQLLQRENPTVEEGQYITKIVDTNGGYIYSIESEQPEVMPLVKLPSKFHNLVFIKKG